MEHEYKIECTWKAIFAESCEYFFAPWGRYYRDAKINYTLEIEVAEELALGPRTYRVPSGNQKLQSFLSSIIRDMSEQKKLGKPMDQRQEGRRTVYFENHQELDRVIFSADESKAL